MGTAVARPTAAAVDALGAYKAKRDFNVTSEPADGGEAAAGALTFVVQKHWATRLHYDFRLELDGRMLSWAVPKGPSFDSRDKRMAVHVEDHPIAYSSFEGTIPAGQYGAGKVIVWDKGTWTPVGDPSQGYCDGNLKFDIHGHKLHGRWVLVRMKGRGEKQEPWLLIKEKDAFVRPAADFSVVDAAPDSVRDLPMPGASVAARAEPPRAPLPEALAPQLATLVDKPPADPEHWVYEIKFDGYRMLARIDGKDVRLVTRNANDWTDKLGPLQKALARMKLPSGWYDGEIVVPNEHGVPDFGLLQQSFDAARTASIVYYLFDVPFLDGFDLRDEPLASRRARLREVLHGATDGPVRFSEVFDAPPAEVVTSACRLGLEGVIAKRKDSRYVSRRSADWIKLKCSQRQEFVIGGYTDPQGGRAGLGSLLLGVHDAAGALKYAGNVGTGFDERTLAELTKRLEAMATDRNPFDSRTGIVGRPHWVRPELVAEVSFGEWTRAHRIRHSVFHGLRSDKPATAIVRETARPAPSAVTTAAGETPAVKTPAAKTSATKTSAIQTAATRTRAAKTPAAKTPVRKALARKTPALADTEEQPLSTRLRVSHPDRVIDASSGNTKIELVRYYATVGDLMMAHLQARPVSLVRAPAGVGGQLFFQKHAETEKLPGIRQIDPARFPGYPAMLEVASTQGLLSAAQWNVIEIHTLNNGALSFAHPDRMVFDLDPGEGVGWPQIQEAADIVRMFLGELGLPAFLKTSGGKGLHVVVPVKKVHDWDTVKGFSQAVVLHLTKTLPDRFVVKSGPKNRVGRIFIDYLRNGLGSTTVAAWSARARPGLGISVPVRWDELKSLRGGDHWTIRSVQDRLDDGNRPWDGYAKAAKSLNAAMKTLGWTAKSARPANAPLSCSRASTSRARAPDRACRD